MRGNWWQLEEASLKLASLFSESEACHCLKMVWAFIIHASAKQYSIMLLNSWFHQTPTPNYAVSWQTWNHSNITRLVWPKSYISSWNHSLNLSNRSFFSAFPLIPNWTQVDTMILIDSQSFKKQPSSSHRLQSNAFLVSQTPYPSGAML